jgi:uncharacterized protein YkwD
MAAIALLLALAAPVTASTAAPAVAGEASGGRAALEDPPKRQQALRKLRRRCHGGRQHVKRHLSRQQRVKRKRACRRLRRLRRRYRAPTGPSLPRAPPPALVPPAPIPAPPPAPPTAACAGADAVPTASNLTTVRAATLCLVNLERRQLGVAPLADDAALAVAAQAHASDMTGQRYFSHVSADGRSFDQRIRAAGYLGGYLAENIAWGGGSLGTPRRIVSGWMNSSGHRANILNGLLTDSGIGVSPGTPQGGSGGTYVHDFGGP